MPEPLLDPLSRPPSPPPPPEPDEWVATMRGLIVWTVLAVAIAVAVGWMLVTASAALVLIYLSALLAVGLAPLVGELERRAWFFGHRPSRTMATTLVYLTGTVIFVIALVVVVPTIVTQAREFALYAPQATTRLQSWLMARGLLQRTVTVQELLTKAPAGSDTLGVVFDTVFGLVGGVAGWVTVLMLSFYFLIESDGIFLTFVRFFPRPRRMQVRQVAGKITTKVSAWLGGQLLLAGMIGVSTALILALLGVPYFWVLAILAAAGELVPYVGPLLAAAPALLVAGGVSLQLAAAVAVFFLVQQQLENHIVVPRVMENQLGLSAATVIVALLIGGSLLGMAGVALAIPTAAILHVLAQELIPAMEER